MENASAIAALASLSYDTRLAAIQLLASAGEEGLAAGEIARRLGAQQSTLSDHLRALAAAGVVIFDRKGRSIIYRANSKISEERCVVQDCVSKCRSRWLPGHLKKNIIHI